MPAADFDRLHQDLAAAVTAGVPLEIGALNSSSNTMLTLAQLDRWREHDPREPSIAADLPIRYRAAAEVFQQTDRTLPVLDALHSRYAARRDVVRALRWPIAYSLIVLAIAAFGMTFFAFYIAPEIEAIRTDLVDHHEMSAPHGKNMDGWLFGGSIALALIVCAALVAAMLGGVERFMMWVGGRRVVEARAVAQACRTIEALSNLQPNPQTAASGANSNVVPVSCKLAGVDLATQKRLEALFPVGQSCQKASDVAAYYDALSGQHLARLKTFMPLAIVISVAGTVTVAYSLLLFGPIISLLYDLNVTGVGQ